MRRLSFLLACMTFLIVVQIPAADAAGRRTKPLGTNWNQHDRAVYVVSTLNLIQLPNGRGLPAALSSEYHVARFDVYVDLNYQELFFILLRTDEGSPVGALAYRMGWIKPRGVSPSIDRLGVSRAPRAIVEAFRSNPLQIIGSFDSTLPS